jgi:predicted transcriptional regulator
MSTREIVTEVLKRLPETASLQDVARELEFVAGVREGFAQLDRGEGVPIEEVERLLPTWIQAPSK